MQFGIFQIQGDLTMHIQKQTFDFKQKRHNNNFDSQFQENYGATSNFAHIRGGVASGRPSQQCYGQKLQIAQVDHVTLANRSAQNKPRCIKKLSSFRLAQADLSGRTSEMANPFEMPKDACNGEVQHLSDQRSTEYSDNTLSGNIQIGSHFSNLSSMLQYRHHSSGDNLEQQMEAIEQRQNVFTMCNSPINHGSNISRRLFEDVLPCRRRVEDFTIVDGVDSQAVSNCDSDFFMQNSEFLILCDQSDVQEKMGSGVLSDEPEGTSDVDEFSRGEQHPLEQLLRMRGRNEFVYDPENGGGRRRRNKKVSRIELLNLQCQPQRSQPMMQMKALAPKNEPPQEVKFAEETQTDRPFGVNISLYQEEPNAKALELIECPRNQSMNSITSQTLASFLSQSELTNRPYLIIDCRFDYEFQGGHIKNAINITDPESMKAFFFRDRETVERLMGTVVVFHCEFSQKRGPKMYQTLREIDRNMHIEHYPLLLSYIQYSSFSSQRSTSQRAATLSFIRTSLFTALAVTPQWKTRLIKLIVKRSLASTKEDIRNSTQNSLSSMALAIDSLFDCTYYNLFCGLLTTYFGEPSQRSLYYSNYSQQQWSTHKNVLLCHHQKSSSALSGS